jgi:hypothetical protein
MGVILFFLVPCSVGTSTPRSHRARGSLTPCKWGPEGSRKQGPNPGIIACACGLRCSFDVDGWCESLVAGWYGQGQARERKGCGEQILIFTSEKVCRIGEANVFDDPSRLEASTALEWSSAVQCSAYKYRRARFGAGGCSAVSDLSTRKVKVGNEAWNGMAWHIMAEVGSGRVVIKGLFLVADVSTSCPPAPSASGWIQPKGCCFSLHRWSSFV